MNQRGSSLTSAGIFEQSEVLGLEHAVAVGQIEAGQHAGRQSG
jgi:hypothetical protein